MKYLLSLGLLFSSTTALAGSGFRWFPSLAEKLGVAEHTITYAFVCILLCIAGLVYKMKTSNIDQAVVPDKNVSYRNVFEFFGEFLLDLAKGIMGEKMAKDFFPIIVFLFLSIFCSNLTGLVPGFLPPTDNFNTTFALGIFVFIYYNWHGIKAQGLVGHLKHFMGPVIGLAPLMFIIELISHAVRPVSLGLRLKGNMEGDHLVLTIFSDLVPLLIPVPFYALGIFVSFIQAFVFTLLTMVYISLACEVHDHEHH